MSPPSSPLPCCSPRADGPNGRRRGPLCPSPPLPCTRAEGSPVGEERAVPPPRGRPPIKNGRFTPNRRPGPGPGTKWRHTHAIVDPRDGTKWCHVGGPVTGQWAAVTGHSGQRSLVTPGRSLVSSHWPHGAEVTGHSWQRSMSTVVIGHWSERTEVTGHTGQRSLVTAVIGHWSERAEATGHSGQRSLISRYRSQ